VRWYALAFGLLVAATIALSLAIAGLLQSSWLLYVSTALSALAIAAAAASLVLRR
jgi:hypothetical protein